MPVYILDSGLSCEIFSLTKTMQSVASSSYKFSYTETAEGSAKQAPANKVASGSKVGR
jgi:hypothetical protein